MIIKESIKYRGLNIREIEAKRRKYERNAKTYFKKALIEQQSLAINQVKNAQTITDLTSINPVFKDDVIQSAMVRVYQECGSDFAETTYNNIVKQEQKSLSLELYMAWMKEYAEKQTGNRITLITNTTEERFKQIVKEQTIIGQAEGYSIDKIAANIQKQIGLSNNYRAVRIARTEVVSASNAGSISAAKSTNLSLNKVWLATKTGNTRDSHKEMDGVKVSIDEQFKVPIYDSQGNNIGYDYMQHPGHPDGSAGNVINCRCTIIYERKI